MIRPRDLASKMRAKIDADGFKRETFTLPRDVARAKAREMLNRFPAGGYGTMIERWRILPNGDVEFTMRRLPTAD